MPGSEPRDERVLVLAPTGRDSRLIVDALGGRGLTAFVCADLGQICREVRQGSGAALLAEEALPPTELRILVDTLHGQPPWPDLPLLILTGKGTPSRASVERFRLIEPVANVAQLERPVRARTLVSAVQAALRARRRQYDVRDHLRERERLTRELGQYAARLVETDRQKDEFLATLAHELRNPLAPIRNALEIMSLAGDNRHAVDQSRAMVERQVRQMIRLVDDLLDVSRVTRGKLELKKERMALSWVMATAVETSRPNIDAARHVLNVSLPSERVELDADPTRVSQVISNLLNNAAKYTDPGGRIWLSGERSGDFAIVRVRDTGIGLSPEMLPRVFDMFMQADHSGLRTQGGLGVGLSLVRTLVEMHGGVIEARSAGLGQGSEFTVRLPCRGP